MRPLRPFAPLLLASCAAVSSSSRHTPPLAPYTLPTEPAEPTLPSDSGPVFIRGATVMTAAGDTFSPGHILLRNGVIEEVGAGSGIPPADVPVIEGAGLFITPGIIDTHSHMGVYALPHAGAHDDGNEMTSPNTSELWAEHSFWPQDPALWRAISSGVTTIQVLPGSANLVGGRSFIAHLRPKVSAREMRFPGAVQGVKMACGENPKRVYGERHQAPSTRMGNVAAMRAAFQRADEYRRKWKKYERDLAEWKEKNGGKDDAPNPPDAPERNFANETLAKILDGTLVPQVHCYRADDMSIMLDIAQEFGFHIRSFHHAVEAYKIRDRLAKENVAVSTWDDWGGFKLEAFDTIPQNAPLLSQAGVKVILHSDSETEIRHLNQEAAKGQTFGRQKGIAISDDETLRWVTLNPAWALGIDKLVGSLEKGKRADVVLWNGSPFSVYSRPVKVFIDGVPVFDESIGRNVSDFELGLRPAGVAR